MQIGDFKLVCFSQGIDPRLIDACVPFLEKHKEMFDPNNKVYRSRNVNDDLGYAELADITSLEKGLFKLKDSIFMQTCDYDSRGRSLEKTRMKQMIKDPGKYFNRVVLKTFYISNGVL
jgi:hypothetical protein